MKWIALFSFLICLATSAAGNDIDDVYGAGVFSTKWGDSLQEVQKVYPEGSVASFGDITHYKIKDGRAILGIERSEDDTMVFAFDANKRLISIGVYYDGYMEITSIMKKLESQFGKHQTRKQENATAPIKEWVGQDISLSLILMPAMFSTQTVFGIEYTGPITNLSAEKAHHH